MATGEMSGGLTDPKCSTGERHPTTLARWPSSPRCSSCGDFSLAKRHSGSPSKSIFELGYAEVMLIQFDFFTAYFYLHAVRSRLVNRIGYKRTMVVGLLTMGVGAFLFIPAATVLPIRCSWRPHDSWRQELRPSSGGEPLRSCARSAQDSVEPPEFDAGFNALGTTIAPKIGGLFILSAAPKTIEQMREMAPQALQAYRLQQAASVKLPYTVLGWR